MPFEARSSTLGAAPAALAGPGRRRILVRASLGRSGARDCRRDAIDVVRALRRRTAGQHDVVFGATLCTLLN